MDLPTKYLSQIPVDSGKPTWLPPIFWETKYLNIKRGMSPETIKPEGELHTLATSEISDLFRQSSQTLGTLQSVVDKLNAIAGQIQLGKGSFGKLLVDESPRTTT